MDASANEIALRQQMEALGGTQQAGVEDAIKRAMHGGMFTLSPQDQARLDASFDAGRMRLKQEGQDFAQYLAGTRGLNMSDTPVSEQAMQRFGLGLAELESQRASTGLGLGLSANQLRFNTLLNGANTLPAGNVYAHTSLFNERLAQPTNTVKGFGKVSMYNNPSLLTQVQQGASAYKDFGTGTNQLSQAGMNFGAMSASDERLKRDITPVRWQWKVGGGQEQLGVVAQELERSHPHLVARHPEEGYLMVDYGALTALLLDERRWLYEQLEQATAQS